MNDDFSYSMTVTVPDGSSLPRASRPGPGFSTMTFTPKEVHELPGIRAKVAALGGDVLFENGSSPVRSGAGVGARLRVVLASRILKTAIVGARREKEPCPECGIPATRIRLDANPRFVKTPGAIPHLAQTKEGLLIASAALISELRALGLDDGMGATPVVGGKGASVILMNRELVAGRADEAGCPRCGREEGLLAGVTTPGPARYSIQPAARVPGGSGWWLHPAIGQHLSVVSDDVAAALAAHGAKFEHIRVREIDAAEAWLPKEFR